MKERNCARAREKLRTPKIFQSAKIQVSARDETRNLHHLSSFSFLLKKKRD